MAGIMHMLLSSASSIVTDAYFNLVTLLLPGDGTNGAQNNTFLDSSSNNFTITRNGNTTQGTFSPFSQTGWSNYFNAASNKLSTTGMTALGSDFTLELWVNPSSFADYNTLFDNRTTDGDANGIAFGLTSAAKVYFYSNASFLITTATAISANAWTHIALVRSGSGSGNVKIYINGVADANTATYTTSITRTAPSIGDDWNTRSNLQFYGYLSNMRATTAALYTSNFTPSLVPLTTSVSSGTCVLLTCQSNRFIDNSASALAITVTGTPSVQAFSPFAPTAAYSATTNGGSGYFDGSGDYLTAPANAAFQFGTGDFTIECWINKPAAANAPILDARGSGSAAPYALYVDANNYPYFYDGTSYTSSISIVNNQWNHVAVVRTSSVLKIFVNGVQGYSASNTVTLSPSATIYLGGQNFSGSASYTQGYISNFRIVKGTAVYTSNFTPPTAPLTAITNTSLLLSCTNAGIIDNAAKNDLETVGNAQISTTQSKFGGSSMYFDGVGDYLKAPYSNNFIFGKDFTVEFWLYFTSHDNYGGLVSFATSPSTTTGWQILFNGTSNNLTYESTDGNIISSSTVSANTWTHVAFCRTNGVVTLYINGINNGTLSSTSTLDSTGYPLYVGAERTISLYTAGYIDDLRITKGVARYTSNFTVPSAAFPLS